MELQGHSHWLKRLPWEDESDTDRGHAHVSALPIVSTEWRRWHAEQEARFARERAAEERKREAKTHAAHEPLLLATNQRVGAPERQLLDGLRAVRKITEAVNAELEALRIGNVELKTNFASSRPSLAKLQAEVHKAKVAGRKPSKPGVIDLPAMRVAQ